MSSLPPGLLPEPPPPWAIAQDSPPPRGLPFPQYLPLVPWGPRAFLELSVTKQYFEEQKLWSYWRPSKRQFLQVDPVVIAVAKQREELSRHMRLRIEQQRLSKLPAPPEPLGRPAPPASREPGSLLALQQPSPPHFSLL